MISVSFAEISFIQWVCRIDNTNIIELLFASHGLNKVLFI